MSDTPRLDVRELKDLLPLTMWKLVHAGLVAKTGVSIDVVLNRKDDKGRYVQLRVLPESSRNNPFCSHLRKWREIDALCCGCQRRSLDAFADKYQQLGEKLPYTVDACHAGLFRIVFPLRVHESLVAFLVVHALRQAGNEGVVMSRLRSLPRRANLDGKRAAISPQTGVPHLANVRGFSSRDWWSLVNDLRENVLRIEERLTEAHRRRCAEAEEAFLFQLTEKLPPAHEVTHERLRKCMTEIATKIVEFCNLTCFAYLRRAREGSQLEVVGQSGFPESLDLEVFAGFPPIPVVPGAEIRPLQLAEGEPDRDSLQDCPNLPGILSVTREMSRIYVCPRATLERQSTALVTDMLLFGQVDRAAGGLVEGLESKRSAFEKITQHLSSKLDALYRIVHQQQLFQEMGHEISAPMNGMLLEISYIRSLHECVCGNVLPTEVQSAFDLLTHYVKHVDHKRRNWLYAYGPEGRPNLSRGMHSLGEILHEAVNVYRPLANRESIVVVQDFYFSDLPTLLVDRELIHSVFANLLENAIKYTVGQGATLFTASDLRDPKGLVSVLRRREDRVAVHLLQRFLPETQERLKPEPPSSTGSELIEAIIDELNRLITGPSLWGQGVFTSVPLRDETRCLIKKRRKGEEKDVLALNRMLLEDAFPGMIARRRGRERYIKISKSEDSQWFRLAFSNFGFGIKREWIEQGFLFREGWRLPWNELPSPRRPGEGDGQHYRSGTGIGCAVIRRVMRDHGGDVEVESHKGPVSNPQPVGAKFWSGCKTTFTVKFPKNRSSDG
jgi:signal transduction histidine kinase